MNKTYVVQVIEFGTNKVIKEINCDSLISAERVELGVNISLNHLCFFTEVKEKS